MEKYNCETCHDTGYYGDLGRGIRGNNEYAICDNCDMISKETEQRRDTGQVDAIVTLLHKEATSIEDRNIDNFKPRNVHEFHKQIDTARCLRVAANYLTGDQAG